MNKEMIQRHLALAESHVADGKRHIDDQRELIRRLVQDGHDTTAATTLLSTLEQVQAMHVADRGRLEQELAQCEKDNRNPMQEPS